MNEFLNRTALADGGIAEAHATEALPPVPSIAPQPDLATLPRRVDRRKAAELVSHFIFPTTPRALEDWDDLDWLIVAGKATCETVDLFAVARKRLAAGRRVKRRSTDPPVPSGPRPLR